MTATYADGTTVYIPKTDATEGTFDLTDETTTLPWLAEKIGTKVAANIKSEWRNHETD